MIPSTKYKHLQYHVTKGLKNDQSLEGFLGSLQKLYPQLETDVSVVEETHKIAHVFYDPKTDAAAKLLHDLDRQKNKLNYGALSEQQKLCHLTSKVNDKQFANWTKDRHLFTRMHSYHQSIHLLVERAELSVGLKRLAMNQGIATGIMSTSRYTTRVTVKSQQPLKPPAPRPSPQVPRSSSPMRKGTSKLP